MLLVIHSVCQSVNIHPCLHSSICLPMDHPSIHLCYLLGIDLSIHPPLPPSIHLSTDLDPPIPQFIYYSIYPLIYFIFPESTHFVLEKVKCPQRVIFWGGENQETVRKSHCTLHDLHPVLFLFCSVSQKWLSIVALLANITPYAL